MQRFIAKEWLALLQKNQLHLFELLWKYDGPWFEEPNRTRGGLSGVNYLALTDLHNVNKGLFLKRQDQFLRRSMMHPLVGEPTFLREYQVLRHLQQCAVLTPMVVFFEYKDAKSILITQALEGFVSVDRLLHDRHGLDIKQRNLIICETAKAIKKMHQSGVQHRSLYPKHLFVKTSANQVEVAMIDFEKSRITPLIAWLKFSDLVTLNYRTPLLSRSQRVYFLKCYFGVSKLSVLQKMLCRLIHHWTNKKMNH